MEPAKRAHSLAARAGRGGLDEHALANDRNDEQHKVAEDVVAREGAPMKPCPVRQIDRLRSIKIEWRTA